MRIIPAVKIEQAVRALCRRANTVLRPDVLAALKQAYAREAAPVAKDILHAIIENASVAKKEGLAICQDTGVPCVFIEIGQNVSIQGDLKAAVNRGVEKGYREGYLRNSIVRDPFLRGDPVFTPVVIHCDIVKGSRVKVTVLPKGFGCENKSR
ncbi:MAG: fumarate hydratase, partial [Candidatus Omnitrophica bacterium]|nr:fumarate hydratase [Candidatus Omnitrophota bacterium]